MYYSPFWNHCRARCFCWGKWKFCRHKYIIAHTALSWFRKVKSTKVPTFHFELSSQFLKWVTIVITRSVSGIIDIYSPYFFIYGTSVQFIPLTALGHKLHWWAINEKLWAINIYNTLENCVIVIKWVTRGD